MEEYTITFGIGLVILSIVAIYLAIKSIFEDDDYFDGFV